jgi:hypothetical protein
LISALLVGNVVAIVFWVWYPKPAFEVAGAFSIVSMLIGIDLVLGPILTLIVYKHGKPGLKLDLSVIALVQITALVYGSYVLYIERPSYLVFAVDRIEFVSSKQIDHSTIQYDELKNKSFAKLTPVFARIPEDPDEYDRFFDSIIFEGKPDLESRTEYWEPWIAGADHIRQKIMSLEELDPATPDEKQNVQRALDEYAGDHPNLGVIPVGGTEADIGILVDRDTLQILGALAANPWPKEKITVF